MSVRHSPRHYAPTLTLREARGRYFADNGFAADGGYSSPWVELKLGPFGGRFPNTPGRVRAVRYHDLHHVVTGYPTTNRGEAEIGTWEVASSCADHWAAWVLNLYAMLMGLWIAPLRTFRAFVRGRHSQNLYREPFDDALLDAKVGETRERLGVATNSSATAADVGAFMAWMTLAALLGLATLAPLGALGYGVLRLIGG